MDKKISAIIVNFNTGELLDKCVENLRSSELIKEIIVVDNGSTDSSTEMLKEKYLTTVTLIQTENNGLASGYNLGFRESTGDYLLYIGTDAYPTPDALQKLLAYLEPRNYVGIVTPKLITREGKMDMDAHRGFPTPWAALTHFTYLDRLFPKSSLFNQYYMGYEDMSEEHEIDACISHFMLVRRDVHNRIGYWDQEYFLFGEDIDFCFRTKRVGYRIMYLPEIEVLHYKGATVGRKESKDLKTPAQETEVVKKRIPMETTRAMRIFYGKFYEDKYPKILTGLVLLAISVLERFRFVKTILG